MVIHLCIHLLGELGGFEEMLCDNKYSAKPNHTYFITVFLQLSIQNDKRIC